MRTIRISAAVAALMMVSVMIGGAAAQDEFSQGQSAGSMMGTWGPRGMMGFGSGMRGYGGMEPGMMGWGESGQAMCSAMASHIDGRLAYIKAELKITEAQEPFWNFLRRRRARQCRLHAGALHRNDEPARRIFGQLAGSARPA